MSKRPADEDGGRMKRARVSLACIECRKKKERCDGQQPACGTCQNHNRQCCYATGQKKRGLPSGYVRALEILLGLVFHSVQDSELSTLALLHGDAPVPSTDVDSLSTSTINFFADTWRESTVWKELEKILLSAEPKDSDSASARLLHDRLESVMKATLKWDTGGGCHEEDADKAPVSDAVAEASPVNEIPAPLYQDEAQHPSLGTPPPSLRPQWSRLPPNWPELVDIYYTNTHCWFPIVPKQDILRAGHALAASSSDPAASPTKSGELAALWAVLSYASYQHLQLTSSSSHSGQESDLFRENAVYLTTNTDAPFESGHVQTLLVLGLLRLGQRDASQAWLLVGRAVYMAVDLGIFSGGETATISPLNDRRERLCFGCFVLDTLVACRLGRRPYLRSTDLPRIGLTQVDGIEEWEFCSPITSGHRHVQPVPAMTLSTFNSFLQIVSLINDIANMPSNNLDTDSLENITQKFMNSTAPRNLHQLSLQQNSSMTPQSLNLITSFASLCAFLRSKPSSMREPGRLHDPWEGLPGLSNVAARQMQEKESVRMSPLCDVYLHILATCPKPCHRPGPTFVSEESKYMAMIDTLRETFDEQWRIPLINQPVFRQAQNQISNQELPSVQFPAGLAAYQDITSAAEMESRVDTDNNGLYDSMLSLDMGDWPGVSRGFLQNLGISQTTSPLDCTEFFHV